MIAQTSHGVKIVTGAVLLHDFRKRWEGKMSLENYS